MYVIMFHWAIQPLVDSGATFAWTRAVVAGIANGNRSDNSTDQ